MGGAVWLGLGLFLKPLTNRADRLFVGWFGSIAIAVYYASLSLERTGIEEVWAVGTLIICASIFAHGLTATPLTRLYRTHTSYRKHHRDQQQQEQE